MSKISVVSIPLTIVTLLLTAPVYAQFELFDQTVDWPQIGNSHVEGEAIVEGSGANAQYRVTGNGSFGLRIEEGYGVAGDEGFYLYTDKTGSWSLQAKLYPVWGPSALMIRENADDPASNFYSVQFGGVVGESVNALFRTRTGASGNVTLQLFGPDEEPIQDTGEGMWFRVTRIEPVDMFFGEYSPDGQTWYIADSQTMKWPSDTAAFGIAVGSGADDEEIGEVEASSVSFVSTPPVAQRNFSQQSYKENDTIGVKINVYVSGEDRSTATIEEIPPEGWAISEVSNGGTESNGVIQWNLSNLPVGETTVAYQVTAPSAPSEFAEWTGHVKESVEIAGVDLLPFLNITGGDRVSDGLVLFYPFDEGGGEVVHDRSGMGEPMDLTIEQIDKVFWGDGFLETTGVNHIETEGPALKLIEACIATDEITIEGWIKTSNINQNGPARIITCSIDASDRNFTLGQGHYNAGGDRFEMRYRTDIADGNPKQVISVNTDRGTFTEALTHVVFTRSQAWEVNGYVNNEWLVLSDEVEFVEGGFSTWDTTYKFGLGNEVSAARAWLGQLHLVAIYNRALTAEDVSKNYNAGPFVGDETDVREWSIY